MRNFSTGTLYASSVFVATPVILIHSFPPYTSASSSKNRETTSRRQRGTGMRHDGSSGLNVKYRWCVTAVVMPLSVRNARYKIFTFHFRKPDITRARSHSLPRVFPYLTSYIVRTSCVKNVLYVRFPSLSMRFPIAPHSFRMLFRAVRKPVSCPQTASFARPYVLFRHTGKPFPQ